MRYTDTLRLSATDLSNHLGCRHLTALDLSAATGKIKRPAWKDPTLEVLRERGLRHEKAYIDHLRERGTEIVELPADEYGEEAVRRTLATMRDGPEVIAQAALASGHWWGRADFLRRVDSPSDLGEWSYEVLDTKLARETRGGTILQLCLYAEMIGEMQGRTPEFMYVVKPGTEYVPEQYRVLDYAAFYRRVRARLEDSVTPIEAEPSTYPDPCAHCDICQWRVACDRHRRNDDHLCLVAGVSKLQTRELQKHGVDTLEKLGELVLPLPFSPERGSRETYSRVREQARVQLEGRRASSPVYELLSLEEGQGLARLPEPSPGDVFFDFEGDPFVGEHGREYLFGYVTVDGDEVPYHARWALTASEERSVFQEFVDTMVARWEQFPDFHIYHYAPYEPAALKRLMGRYATREDEVDRLLRGERFVDLYAVVKQSLRASVERYSIKDLEPFYGFERPVELHEANLQRHALQHALELEDTEAITDEMRETVAGYNRDDCVSTHLLRCWLEELRAQHIKSGETILRPELKEGDAAERLTEEQERVRELMERLTRDVPLEPEERSREEHARWLLAQVLEWHRREDKAVWWDYYRLRDLMEEELLDEREAIAGLRFVDRVERVNRSVIDRYAFPPQETSVRGGDELKTSLIEKGRYGVTVGIDVAARTIDIKKGPKHAELHATTVFVHDAVPSRVLKESLCRMGEATANNGIDTDGEFRAGRDLLLARAPRCSSEPDGGLVREGETTLAAARRLVLGLEDSVLPIQGPPGSGKTYAGARMICELVAAGKKVGITAASHKVVRNLLDETAVAAEEEGVAVRCLQRVRTVSEEEHPTIAETTDNEGPLNALGNGECHVAAGTAWLWARESYIESVDTLFIDEAGQMSLANVLAVAPAARNIVLLGDPQQLEQPQVGSHPEGTDVSALEHILAGDKTMSETKGLFLHETRRLPPEICAYTSELFYESRLRSYPGRERRRLVGDGEFTGAGLWFVPVEHEGNRNSSPEETECVRELVQALTTGRIRWEDESGDRGAIGMDEILVVAPYNAQVAALSESIPDVRVGTVDKFQGQEAPIAIYSMTTSSPEDAPRGMEFLYSLNRLNVATSRAKCRCFLVANPRLLEAECRTPRHMKLANAFCRYVEMARVESGVATWIRNDD